MHVAILFLVTISMVVEVGVIGTVKIVVDIVTIEDMEGVVGGMVEEGLLRSLMNPHSLHLLVGFQMVLYKETLIESLKT